MVSEKQFCLTIEIKYKNVISLLDFKQSLEGWYNQYNEHLFKANIPNDEETLFIQEVRSGSIIVEFVSSIIPLLSDVSTITSFYISMKNLIDWLIAKNGKKPKCSIEELEALKQIIAPIKTNDNSINFYIEGNKNTVVIIDKEKAQKINRRVNEELMNLPVKIEKEPISESSNKEKVLLKFKQVEGSNNNVNKNTKGVISEIDNKPHPVLFEKGIKHTIVHGADNPLMKNYLVDVKVHQENGGIKAYTVLNVIDSYDNASEGHMENSLFP